MSNIQLNIQPKAGILGVFSRLNYKPWYAIGEFVDNSTASFFAHKRTMNFYKLKKVTIEIDYDSFLNILTIKDNAYGMEIEDFKRAVLLDSVPENNQGRNEFGMGLKTAASWFGNAWSVSSTQLNSTNHYYTKIDINKLRREDLNSIEIIQKEAQLMEHGTTIEITDVTKRIDSPKTKSKIKELLSSMYRRDILSGDVDIYFCGSLLKPFEYEVLKFREREWKKDLDFDFEFSNKKFNVTGFVGIMPKGSFPNAGFALFRYNRVVVGGPGLNYKPDEIFSQAQSQISLKMFGELNMEDFPVNQAKDGFVWDDGLEDAFLSVLKQNIKEYINIADLSISQRVREEEYSQANSKKVEDSAKEDLEGVIFDENTQDDSELTSNVEQSSDESLVDIFLGEMIDDDKGSKTLYDSSREYNVQLDQFTFKKFNVIWKIAEKDIWFEYDEVKSQIFININHPFFKPYSEQSDFKVLLDKFVVAYVSAEELSKKIPQMQNVPAGYVLPSTLRNKINSILKKLS